MRNKFALAKIASKMQSCRSLSGISGPALSLILMVIFIAGCAKDTINDQSTATPPADVVAATVPADLADTVVIDPTLTVNFKNGTIPSDIYTSKITLQQGETFIEGTVSYTTGTASFKPDNDLMPYTQYTARVVTSLKDDATRKDYEHEWSFKTGMNRHCSIPVIVSVIPLIKTTSVPVTIQPSVTFSEEIDASTVNSSTFTLFHGSKQVTGTISYAGKTATFKPNSNLIPDTEYIGTITGGVKNANGIPLAYGYAWNFTTEANE